MTYSELYKAGCQSLADANIAEARLDARLLMEFVCKIDRNFLMVHGDSQVEETDEALYMDVIGKRSEHIPLQHITGVQNFMGFDFSVDEHVLIPRQDTEILVEEVLINLHDGMRIADLCTGSGCIITSLIALSNDCSGVGVDLSKDALRVAVKNAENILAEDKCHNVEFVSGDVLSDEFWENGFDGKFEVIVSNPPYIVSSEIETLMPEVRDYEPRMALDGSESGLVFYEKISKMAAGRLYGGGMLFFEIGYDQGEAVAKLMQDAGFSEVTIKKDYAGLDRVVYGTYC